jgi:hypothetical protein
MVGHLRHIEEDLTNRVASGLGFDKIPDAPVAATPVQEMAFSPALQTIGKMKDLGLCIGSVSGRSEPFSDDQVGLGRTLTYGTKRLVFRGRPPRFALGHGGELNNYTSLGRPRAFKRFSCSTTGKISPPIRRDDGCCLLSVFLESEVIDYLSLGNQVCGHLKCSLVVVALSIL